jgi:hypothetical protein
VSVPEALNRKCVAAELRGAHIVKCRNVDHWDNQLSCAIIETGCGPSKRLHETRSRAIDKQFEVNRTVTKMALRLASLRVARSTSALRNVMHLHERRISRLPTSFVKRPHIVTPIYHRSYATAKYVISTSNVALSGQTPAVAHNSSCRLAESLRTIDFITNWPTKR